MTAAETLEKAKGGDENAYKLLCNDEADGLYSAAFLVLGETDGAVSAVKGAFSDGFASIARINDLAHLRAWLSRELTKHLVATLKEYRSEGRNAAGVDAFSKLSGLDRIICALKAVFGYSAREIAVITGMTEEAVARKLSDSEKKVKNKAEILSRVGKAPDTLKYTVETVEEAAPEEEIPQEEAVEEAAPEEEIPQEEAAEEAAPEEEIAQEEAAEEAAPEEEIAQEEAVEETAPEEEIPQEKTAEEAAHEELSEKKNNIDARTFIGVVTAQKIKGREFLQLIGNTRISNEVYHEIEQNPNLTKGRLIELLESSPLTPEDYYKLLSAVKQRGELIAQKEQMQRQAGLYTPQKQKPAKPVEPVKPAKPAEPVKPAKPVESVKPAKPVQLEEAAEKPFSPKPVADDEAPLREKYKGNEYFIDDDAYYNGVNNGKLIFCAICAVLLLGLSFAVRFLNTGSLLPVASAEARPAPAAVQEKEITSNEELLAKIAEMRSRVQHNTLGYYRSSALPYSEILSDDFCESEKMMYIHDGGNVRAVSLTPYEPAYTGQIALGDISGGEFIGFKAAGDKLYLVFGGENEIYVKTLGSDLSLLGEYRQDGNFVSFRADADNFTAITSLPPEGKNTVLPSFSLGGGTKVLGYNDFYIPSNAVCCGISVIGSVGGGEARVCAVLGGYETYARIDGGKITLIIPDWNSTLIESFRLIGIAAEHVSSETLAGECAGAECYDAAGARAVTYNSAKGCVMVMKKLPQPDENGSAYSVSEGFALDERLSGVCFAEDKVFVISEAEDGSAKLYCADTSGEKVSASTAAPGEVYSEKLAAFGENLIGLSVDSDENGTRSGLRLAVYGYSGGLKLLRSAAIKTDTNTAAEYARYLSGDAEGKPLRITVSADAGYAAVSCVYFDGISEIERFLCFRDSGGTLEKAGDYLLYDVRSNYRYCAIRGKRLYAVTDKDVYAVELK